MRNMTQFVLGLQSRYGMEISIHNSFSHCFSGFLSQASIFQQKERNKYKFLILIIEENTFIFASHFDLQNVNSFNIFIDDLQCENYLKVCESVLNRNYTSWFLVHKIKA